MCSVVRDSWYRRVSVRSDGDCLYHAVVAQCHCVSVGGLRELVRCELLGHRECYEPYLVIPLGVPLGVHGERTTYEARVRASVRPRVWATELGDVAPKAIANALERTILVLSASGGRTAVSHFHPRSGRTASPVYLHVECAHYSIVRPFEALLEWEDQFYSYG